MDLEFDFVSQQIEFCRRRREKTIKIIIILQSHTKL